MAVELADGTQPTVHTAGSAWAAEWVSLPTLAVVTIGGQVVGRLLFDRPMHY